MEASSRKRDKRFVKSVMAFASFLIVYMSSFFVILLIPEFTLAVFPIEGLDWFILFIVGFFCCRWSIIALIRFATRVFPPLANGEKRIVLGAITCLGGLIAATGLMEFTNELFFKSNAPLQIEASQIIEGFPYLVFSVVFYKLSHCYLLNKMDYSDGILFLRTFLSFSDRAIMSTIFGIALRQKKVTALSTPHSNSESWDPFLISFKGNSLFALSSKLPIFLRSTNSNWVKNVEKLIKQNRCVIIDVTEISDAIKTEVKMTTENKEAKNVIWLFQGSKEKATHRILNLTDSSFSTHDNIVCYEQSYKSAIVKMALGVIVCFLVLFLLPLISQLQSKNMQVDLNNIAGLLINADEDVGYNIGKVIGSLLLPIGFLFLVFWKKEVDIAAKKKLAKLIEAY